MAAVTPADLEVRSQLTRQPNYLNDPGFETFRSTTLAVGALVPYLIARYGIMQASSLQKFIGNSQIAIDLDRMLREIVIVIEQFREGILVPSLKKELIETDPNTGTTAADILDKVDRLELLPMPKEQIAETCLYHPNPLPKAKVKKVTELTEEIAARREKWRTLLFKIIDSDESLPDLSAPDREEWERTLHSAALFIWDKVTSSDKPISWIDLIGDWREHPRLRSAKWWNRVLKLEMPFAEEYPQIGEMHENNNTDDSFRSHFLWVSVEALQLNLSVTFSVSLKKEIMDYFGDDESARKMILCVTARPRFATLSTPVPNAMAGHEFLNIARRFLLFRTAIADPALRAKISEKFDWFFSAEEEDLAALPPPPPHLQEAVEGTACCLGHIPPERTLHLFSTLMKVGTPARIVKQNVAAIVQLRNAFDCDGIPSYPFWVQVCQINRDLSVETQNFIQMFHLELDYRVPNELLEATLLRFFEGKFHFFHLFPHPLSFPIFRGFGLNLTVPEQMAVLARLERPLPYPINEEQRKVARKALDFVKQYDFDSKQLIALIIQFLLNDPSHVEQQIGFIRIIEEFIGYRLIQEDVFNWLIYFPDVKKAEEIFSRLFIHLGEIILLLDTVFIPPSFFQEMTGNLIKLTELPQQTPPTVAPSHPYSAANQASAEFTRTSNRLFDLLQGAMVSPNAQLFTDFITIAATQDRIAFPENVSRDVGMIHALNLTSHSYPHGIAIHIHWDIPTDDTKFAAMNICIANMSTQETHFFSVTLRLPWHYFLKDPHLFPLLRQMAIHMGKEEVWNHKGEKKDIPENAQKYFAALEKKDPTIQPGILESDIVIASPIFQESWRDYKLSKELPSSHTKNALGQILYDFVVQIRSGFRLGAVDLTTRKDRFTRLIDRREIPGHIYRDNNELTLTNNDSINDNEVEPIAIDPTKLQLLCTELKSAFAEVKKGKEESIVGRSLHTEMKGLEKLRFSFFPLKTSSRAHNKFVLQAGGHKVPLHYFDEIDQETFAKRMEWHLLILLAKILRTPPEPLRNREAISS